jgi:cobalt/nickel transport system permease protein
VHIPDGFLSAPVVVSSWGLTAGGVGIALKRVGQDLGERQVPVMGALAACIFAGQMLNFPIGGGTSGHLMGAALATIVLGPWAAMLVLTCVVGVQALVFQDGGLLALGANVLNMGLIGVLVAHAAYRSVRRLLGTGRPGVLIGGFLAGWLSIVVAALAVAFQLALSGTAPANVVLPAMGVVHAVIGIAEGLITVGALAAILAARADLLAEGGPAAPGPAVAIGGLGIALALLLAAPLASADPDGLEYVAEQLGFLAAAQDSLYALIPDYRFPGLADEGLATILAGFLGVVIVFAASIVVGRVRARRSAAR